MDVSFRLYHSSIPESLPRTMSGISELADGFFEMPPFPTANHLVGPRSIIWAATLHTERENDVSYSPRVTPSWTSLRVRLFVLT